FARAPREGPGRADLCCGEPGDPCDTRGPASSRGASCLRRAARAGWARPPAALKENEGPARARRPLEVLLWIYGQGSVGQNRLTGLEYLARQRRGLWVGRAGGRLTDPEGCDLRGKARRRSRIVDRDPGARGVPVRRRTGGIAVRCIGLVAGKRGIQAHDLGRQSRVAAP